MFDTFYLHQTFINFVEIVSTCHPDVCNSMLRKCIECRLYRASMVTSDSIIEKPLNEKNLFFTLGSIKCYLKKTF